MIGNFAFCETLRADQLAVDIDCSADGSRTGRILMAQEWIDALPREDVPDLECFPIEAAFSYGVFLAMKFGAPLVVTGDPSAWNPAWGVLLEDTPFWARRRSSPGEPRRMETKGAKK